ncbi:hypothetical protein [Oricola indica]|uniref:hypothetical protein n=1 Tax=Oricola indica TaxID=2872591 RepID=UPI003CCBF4AF
MKSVLCIENWLPRPNRDVICAVYSKRRVSTNVAFAYPVIFLMRPMGGRNRVDILPAI